MNWPFIMIAVLIGMAIAAQPSINQAAVRVLGAPVSAAVVSVSITMGLMLFFLLATGAKVEPAAVARLPWWVALGGVAGFVIVFGGLSVVPVTGAASFFVCLVAGQLLGAALIDHLGAFGMAVRPISAQRIAGIALVFCGVGMVVAGSQPKWP